MPRTSAKLIKQIEVEIFSGLLKPGDQLEEAALAKRFGVSRTPIREAIRSLVDNGLLETRPRKGAFVKTMTAKELHDLFEVAAELEGMAARLASEKLTQIHKEVIKQGLETCIIAAQSSEVSEYAKANLKFHTAIHKASGNQWLIDQLEQIQARINVYRILPYEIVGRIKKSVEEHEIIANSIFQADGDAANKLMRDHIMLQGARLPTVLNALN